MTTTKDILTQHIDAKAWKRVNTDLLAKSLAELMHEEIIVPEVVSREEDGLTHFRLRTDHEHIHYTFSAYPRFLDYWHIEKQYIRKWENGRELTVVDVLDFFVELQHTFGIDPFTLAHYIEEMLNTLYADARIHTRGKLSADSLAAADYQTVEHQMDGHPWVIINKGRIGFDYTDHATYAPEMNKQFKLFWLAAHKNRAKFFALENIDMRGFYTGELGEEKVLGFEKKLKDLGLDPEDYIFLPVHEWQLNNKVVFQFQQDLAMQFLVFLGAGDNLYAPQQSIRTLFNMSDPSKHYVKTAVSILSTGNIRGLSPRQMANAPGVTKWVKGLLDHDPYLQRTGVILLGEVATVAYHHPQYSAIKDSPYQYKEMLGALWRESAVNYLKPGEKLMTMAALLYIDDEGCPLVKALVRKSGLSVQDWIEAYLKAYLKPLLHIYYQHSLCVTPHGENIVLVMRDGVPERMVIKDFVDDIVLTTGAREKLPPELADSLIHSSNKENVPLFILLGVFDAFFRYLSDILHSYLGYNEQLFWNTVAATVHTYQQEHPHLAERFEKYDLFVPEFKRFYINSSKLRSQGYAERTGFVIPKKGGKLANPLYLVKQKETSLADG